MYEYKQFDIVYADLSGKGTIGSEHVADFSACH